MAEDSSQEKTEDATPKHLRDAREKGQVPKSKDVSTILVLIVEFGCLAIFMGYMGGQLQQYFKLCIEALSHNVIEGSTIMDLGKAGLIAMAKMLAPFFVGGLVMGIFSNIIQVGVLFTGDPLIPKLEKLNPIEGLKNMFKITTFVELFKNIIKIGIMLYFGYSAVAKSIDAVMNSSRVDLFISSKIAGDIIFDFMVKVCAVSIVIAVIDYMIQRWNFMKNLRMSKDEVKREYKEQEGDPHVKGERRQLQRQMVFGDTKKAVKKADVVVTNPAHVACVLEYNKKEMGAPTLTAKGQRNFAQLIIDMANEEGIPIVRNIPLAWSLVKLEIDDEVPEDLYEAVAEVLTLVYDMKKAKEEPQKQVAPKAPPTGSSPPSIFVP